MLSLVQHLVLLVRKSEILKQVQDDTFNEF
jgi:hypothetical protein